MLGRFKDWLRWRRELGKRFSVTILDGIRPGEVSYRFNNVESGANVSIPEIPPGVKIPFIKVTEGYILQLCINGSLAIGDRIRKSHLQCAAAEEEKKCDICKFARVFREFMMSYSQPSGQEIPMRPTGAKIIVPPDARQAKDS